MTFEDWKIVELWLSETLSDSIGPIQVTPISGGDINEAYRIEVGNSVFFAKANQRELLPMFEAELQGLLELHQCQCIRVPKPIGCGLTLHHSFIVMEYIKLARGSSDILFAQQLAALHKNTKTQYGYIIDNTIGSTPQINQHEDDWITFWQKHRLGYQLQLAQANGHGNRLFDSGMLLAKNIAQFFENYEPQASLLHGDLWSGNQGIDSAGNPVIFDPACYYGDHEADLAMLELFGQPGPEFFKAYHQVFPIDDGYIVRRDLYNLYHILNHLNLFGVSYLSQAQRLIDNLSARFV